MHKKNINFRYIVVTFILVFALGLVLESCAPSRHRRRPPGSSRRKGGTPCMNWSYHKLPVKAISMDKKSV